MSSFESLRDYSSEYGNRRYNDDLKDGMYGNIYTPTAFHVHSPPSQPQPPPPPVSMLYTSQTPMPVKQYIRCFPTQSMSAPAKQQSTKSSMQYDREKENLHTATNTIHNLTGAHDTLGHIDNVYKTIRENTTTTNNSMKNSNNNNSNHNATTVPTRVLKPTSSSRSRQRERVLPDTQDMRHASRSRSQSTNAKFTMPLSHLHPGPFPQFTYLLPPPVTATLPLETVHIQIPLDNGIHELQIQPGENTQYQVQEFARTVDLEEEDTQTLYTQVIHLIGSQYAERYNAEIQRRSALVEVWRGKRQKWLKAGGDPKACPDEWEEAERQPQVTATPSARARSTQRAELKMAEKLGKLDGPVYPKVLTHVEPKWEPSSTSLVTVDGENSTSDNTNNNNTNNTNMSLVERTMLYQSKKEANLKSQREKKEDDALQLTRSIATNRKSDKLVSKQREKVRVALAAVKYERDVEAQRVLDEAKKEQIEKGDLEGAENVQLVYQDAEQREETIPEIVDNVGARLYLDAQQRDWHLRNKIAEKKEQDRQKEEEIVNQMYPRIPESNRKIQIKALKEANQQDVYTRLDLSVQLKRQNQEQRNAAMREQQEKEESTWFKTKLSAKSEKIVNRMAESHYEGTHTMWSVFYERLYKDHFDRMRRSTQRTQAAQSVDSFTPSINKRSIQIVQGKDEEVGKYKAALWGQLALQKQVVSVNESSGIKEENGKQVFPESFFRTDAGKVYMDKMGSLIENQQQEASTRMEEIRRERNLTGEHFLQVCDKYTVEVPGDEQSVLVLRQRELQNQLSMLDMMVNKTLASSNTSNSHITGLNSKASPKMEKLRLLKEKRKKQNPEKPLDLHLSENSLQQPSSQIVSTKKQRQLRDAAVDAIAAAHDTVRKEDASLAKQEWLDEVYREHHNGQSYVGSHGIHDSTSKSNSTLATTGGISTPVTRGRSRSVTRGNHSSSNTSNDTHNDSNTPKNSNNTPKTNKKQCKTPKIPFSRTRERSASRSSTPHHRKDMTATQETTFPEEYLRMVSGRARQLAKNVADEGYVSCTAMFKLHTLGPLDQELVKACLLEIAQDKKANYKQSKDPQDAQIHNLFHNGSAITCEEHQKVWKQQPNHNNSDGWLHVWESWRMPIEQFSQFLVDYAKYVQVLQTQKQVQQTAQKQTHNQDYWMEQAVLAANYASELKQEQHIHTQPRLRISYPTKELPKVPPPPSQPPQQTYAYKYQQQPAQHFANMPYTHPSKDSLSYYNQYAGIAK